VTIDQRRLAGVPIQVGAGADQRGFGELRAGALGVRIASSAAEIEAAQKLRYRVFYEELGASASAAAAASRLDQDHYDEAADHLLVIDHAIGAGAKGVVGTYRLLQREGAAKVGQFYSADEYDLSALTHFRGNILELGRSCIDLEYRGRAAMQLLWRGIAAYIYHHKIDILFGCASLPGTDPDRLAAELTYLYQSHLAPPALRLRALADRYVDMQRADPETLDMARVMAQLPPLVKGYLRLGGFVGDGAVIDHQFNTVDVAVVVKSDLITDKYYRHYERQLRDALD